MENWNLIIDSVLKKYSVDSSNLIPLLQDIQNEFGYISLPVVERIADYLKITENKIYGVASFFSQFRFTPRGRHSISACLGTACHVCGGEILLETLERELEVKPGECTADMRFDLNRVACLGCCALAPVLKVDGDIYGNVTVIKLKEILAKYE